MPARLIHRPIAASWRVQGRSCRCGFSSSTQHQAVGPEHPQYIPIAEPPQQNLPSRPPVKGILPVPRNIFAGRDQDKTDHELLAESTPRSHKPKAAARGSREEWKTRMSQIRRQNYAEGLQSLRVRQQSDIRRTRARAMAKEAEREQLLHRPQREDERLTAPSNNLDLDALFNKAVPDPTRERRIEQKMHNVRRVAESRRQARMDSLHTLYMNARDFIVTPQQLDKAVDLAFGTAESPKQFGSTMLSDDSFLDSTFGKSIWSHGRPEKVQDMLNRATGQKFRTALDSAGGVTEINKSRIRRIAESLTGGDMENETR